MENQFEIRRDGEIAKDYKPKVIKKRIVNAAKAVAWYFAIFLALRMFKAILRGLGDVMAEIKQSIALDYMDYKYGTSLRKQRDSGLRTQAILATKRKYGLI